MMTRKLAEDCRRIDVRNLPRTGLRTVLRWDDAEGKLTARAVLEVDGEMARIAYRWREGERWLARKLDVALQPHRTPAGGVYHVWRCPPPRCGKGAKVLYEAVAGEWGCKTCWGLPSPATGKPVQDRVARRLRKLRGYCGGSEDLSLPFPARPEGMMPATYAMLREEARQLEEVLTRTLVLGPAYIAHGVRRAHANWYPAKNAAARRKGAKPL